MSLEWTRERPAQWDADKARIVGAMTQGVFDRRFASCRDGEMMEGDWWRVEKDGTTVGYGWLDLVWGDAEILLATSPEVERQGVGSFILEKLELEAKQMGVNYLYNIVRSTHPSRDKVTAWFEKRGFVPSEDGSLLRVVAGTKD